MKTTGLIQQQKLDSRCAAALSAIHNSDDETQQLGHVSGLQDAEETGNHLLCELFANQADVDTIVVSADHVYTTYTCRISAWGEFYGMTGRLLRMRVNRDRVVVSCFIRYSTSDTQCG